MYTDFVPVTLNATGKVYANFVPIMSNTTGRPINSSSSGVLETGPCEPQAKKSRIAIRDQQINQLLEIETKIGVAVEGIRAS